MGMLSVKWCVGGHNKSVLSALIMARAEKQPEGFDLEVHTKGMERFNQVIDEMGLTVCQIAEEPYNNMHCFGVYSDKESMDKREALR